MMKYLLILLALSGCTNSAHPPLPSEPKPTESGYINVDQGKLFYEKFGSGSPIIVLHGGPGGDHKLFLPQMLELAKAHEVIFYDQRGSGASLETPYTPELINLKQFIKDLDDVRQHFGHSKVILLGHSWGGRLALEYALAHPHQVEKLILVDPTATTYEGIQVFITDFIMPRMEKFKALMDKDTILSMDQETAIQKYREIYVDYLWNKDDIKKMDITFNRKSALGAREVSLLMTQTTPLVKGFDLRPKLEKLRIQTLIIHGRQDPIPLWTAEQTYNTLPNAEMVVIDNCGHVPYAEKPQEFFEAVRAFLGKKR